MTGPLAGFFSFNEGTVQQYRKKGLDRSQVHEGFLGKIFEGYGFDDDVKKKLDGLLTGYVNAISSVTTGDNADTLDFVLRLNLVPEKNVSGNSQRPQYVYTPTTSLIYLKVDSKTYQQAVSKNNSVSKLDFNMTFTTYKCELNTRQFEANRAKFDAIFLSVTDYNLKEYSKLLGKQVNSASSLE